MEENQHNPNRKDSNQSKKDSDPKGTDLRTYTRYAGLGFQMVIIIVIFAWIGSKLDKRAETENQIYTAIFSLMGVIIGIYTAIKDFIGKHDD